VVITRNIPVKRAVNTTVGEYKEADWRRGVKGLKIHHAEKWLRRTSLNWLTSVIRLERVVFTVPSGMSEVTEFLCGCTNLGKFWFMNFMLCQ